LIVFIPTGWYVDSQTRFRQVLFLIYLPLWNFFTTQCCHPLCTIGLQLLFIGPAPNYSTSS
jgi:hypothetical protein